MLRQKTQLASAYETSAIFRHAERMNLVLAHLQSLNGIGFDLQVNSDAFDHGDLAPPPKDSAVARLLLSRLPEGQIGGEELFGDADDDAADAAAGAAAAGATGGDDDDADEFGSSSAASHEARASASEQRRERSGQELSSSSSSTSASVSSTSATSTSASTSSGASVESTSSVVATILVEGAGLSAANGVYTEVRQPALKDGVPWFLHPAGFELFRFRVKKSAEEGGEDVMWYLGRPADKKVYYFCQWDGATPPLREEWDVRVSDAAPAPKFSMGGERSSVSQFSAPVVRSTVTAVQVKRVRKKKKKKKKEGRDGKRSRSKARAASVLAASASSSASSSLAMSAESVAEDDASTLSGKSRLIGSSASQERLATTAPATASTSSAASPSPSPSPTPTSTPTQSPTKEPATKEVVAFTMASRSGTSENLREFWKEVNLPGTDTAPYWYNVKSGERRWQKPDDNALYPVTPTVSTRNSMIDVSDVDALRASGSSIAATLAAAGGVVSSGVETHDSDSDEAELSALNAAQNAASASLAVGNTVRKVSSRESLPIKAPPNSETSWEVFRDARRRTDADTAFAAERAQKLQSMDALRSEIEKDMQFLADLDGDQAGKLSAELTAADASTGARAAGAASVSTSVSSSAVDVASLSSERSEREAVAHDAFVQRRRMLQDQIAQQREREKDGARSGAASASSSGSTSGSSSGAASSRAAPLPANGALRIHRAGETMDLTAMALSESLFSDAEKQSNESAAALALAVAGQGREQSDAAALAAPAARRPFRKRQLSNVDVAAIAAADIKELFRRNAAEEWGGRSTGGGRKIVLRATIAGASIARGDYAHVQYTLAVNAKGSMVSGGGRNGESYEGGGRSEASSVLALGGLDDSRQPQFGVPLGRAGSTEMSWTVTRRYSRFKALHQWLQHNFPGVELPPLPKTSWRRSFAAQYIETQRKLLDSYLKCLLQLADSGIAKCPAVIAFLTDDDMSGGSFNTGSFPTTHDDDLAPCRGIEGGLHLSLVVEAPRDDFLDDKSRLALQGNRCAQCKASLQRGGQGLASIIAAGNARKCEYTYMFFCADCHANEKIAIPARGEREGVGWGVWCVCACLLHSHGFYFNATTHTKTHKCVLLFFPPLMASRRHSAARVGLHAA